LSLSSSRRSDPWNRSTLPVVVGWRGAVSRWMMPLSRQIRSNSTSPPLAETISKLLAIVGQYFGRDAELGQRGGERQAHRPARRTGHHLADHAVP
jgi:hypothetical protein